RIVLEKRRLKCSNLLLQKRRTISAKFSSSDISTKRVGSVSSGRADAKRCKYSEKSLAQKSSCSSPDSLKDSSILSEEDKTSEKRPSVQAKTTFLACG